MTPELSCEQRGGKIGDYIWIESQLWSRLIRSNTAIQNELAVKTTSCHYITRILHKNASNGRQSRVRDAQCEQWTDLIIRLDGVILRHAESQQLAARSVSLPIKRFSIIYFFL